jgi:uracil-DNA glycosylase
VVALPKADQALTADLFGDVPALAQTEDGASLGAAQDGHDVRDVNAALADIPADWWPIVDAFRHSPSGQTLLEKLQQRLDAGATVYPPVPHWLAALRHTPLAQARVVILGQDPYHGPGQAHGLSFSVPPGQGIPPSLRNIRKELARDLKLPMPDHGCLQAWCAQGVLLLNTVLTVEDGQAAAHAKWGWEALTDALIAAVAAQPGPRVFLLWGAHAQRKRELIAQAAGPQTQVLVLCSNHPSPLSATRPPEPFVGNGHFSKAAAFVAQHAQAGQDAHASAAHEKSQRLDWSLA